MAESFERLKRRWQAESDARKALSASLRMVVRERCPPIFARFGVEKAVLYGSVAEGKADRGSDVDLLVMPLGNDVYWELMHELEEVLDRPVDLYTDRDDPTWVRKILERGEVVYETQPGASQS